MDKKELDEIKVTIADVFSDFYNDVIKTRFDTVDERLDKVDEKFDEVSHEMRDLRLSTEALVKIVDYTRLESRVLEPEDRIKKLERKAS
ncbi:MAG: hypothetical protein AAGA66_11230 [Bacteroidota bacterium]